MLAHASRLTHVPDAVRGAVRIFGHCPPAVRSHLGGSVEGVGAVFGAVFGCDHELGAENHGWFEMANRLRTAAWRLGSATYCLWQWSEPTDDRADIDDHTMPGDELLGDDERARCRPASQRPPQHDPLARQRVKQSNSLAALRPSRSLRVWAGQMPLLSAFAFGDGMRTWSRSCPVTSLDASWG